jgi:hypothetical protein
MSAQRQAPASRQDLVVVRAGAAGWAVAYARKIIPGALLRTRSAAIAYAAELAHAAGFAAASLQIVEHTALVAPRAG